MTTTHGEHLQTDEEREWEAQEIARRQQRQARQGGAAAPPSSYQKIAALLAEADVPPPPSNLAYMLAQHAAAAAQARRREDQAFLRTVRCAFLLGYGGCMLLACVLYRDTLIAWLALPQAGIVAAAAGWVPVLAACLAISGFAARKRALKD